MSPDFARGKGTLRGCIDYKSVKVVHVLGAMNFGGVETNALHLVRDMADDDIATDVYYTGIASSPREEEFIAAADRYVRCPLRQYQQFQFVLELSRWFRVVPRPDVVLSYAFGNHLWVAIAARIAGVSRCYVRVAADPGRDPRTKWKSMAMAHAARPFCNGEVAISFHVGEQLKKELHLPSSRIRVIRNGCDVKGIATKAQSARRRRGSNERPSILMIARMDDAKDQATLIRAGSTMLRSGLGITIRLAGDGPERPHLQALCRSLGIENSVQFLGVRTDIPDLLGSSDIAVLSSKTEGLGTVLLEAMSASTPVVASDLPACREVLEGGSCGIMFPIGDADALAEAIRRLLTDKDMRDQITKRAFERVSTYYDVARMTAEYRALLVGGNVKTTRAERLS